MELNFIVYIVDRDKAETTISLCKCQELPMTMTMLGKGTARKEHLALYGLESTEKAVVATIADGERTRQLVRQAKKEMYIDIPGNGIMMAIPVKSVGGGRTLAYITDKTAADGGTPDMHFEHELIMVVLNEGYTDQVMDAARSAGASGGTVLHAKGTGARRAERFFGVSLANEKEIVFIVSKAAEKAGIMKAIIREAGPESPAAAIVFSLPVSTIAGLRQMDEE